MAHLIDKDAVVAKITHKIKVLEAFIKNFDGISDKVEKAKNKIEALGDALSFINTLEVKEVDLKEEVERFAKECGYKSAATIDFQFAKHFFELGLSVSNKAQKGE